jgi:SAM-dependent methyltransferase
MRTRFYDSTRMGEGFEGNPVLPVQPRQLEPILACSRSRPLEVLDLGCDTGTISKHLLSGDGLSVVGADVSPTAVATCVLEVGRPAMRVDATALPFTTSSFDLVVSDDVVGHLVDTDQYAREVHRVLRPGGLLLLSTPNLAAWFNRLALLLGSQPALIEDSSERVFGQPGDDVVGHLRLFTWKSTRQFLMHHGFEVIELAGTRFEAMTGVAGAVDRIAARVQSLAGITTVVARAKARNA